ncbi:CerR family C-terminal domain-containing protein [Cupriavidus plantarum]|uniref:TetR family transcriptional regulator n=1 Tax=Cupriavidus plantarum TaxID=942865 RepID=A0A316ETD9_9BURK|nr:CerR family C-terminal domain-containing protein [Cupriavidus plantarum]NYI01234.1 AcrR family transcriptional regulator [Cupriavidus plantarum]PWK35624.1 TetR family transcriptional regulator [Cupriavidus plantarum]REE94086.1 TetR family transcriptional regulator [Cupriavidus plantarum]RLK39500.1 TetR family transcriptional regulator [Cupriavidus plantarum]CAG2133429.1 HTH-type transcriptional dual regulator CecR [Cupriavidus plantarum]
MARHRPAAEGGYQRGEETRARIIEAAIELFGTHGFDGASTRDIARHAGVNAPALQYYFDNKEGVYLACIQYIVDSIWVRLEPSVSAAEAVLARADAGDEALMDAYLAIQGVFVTFASDCGELSPSRQFLARERAGLGPPAAFEVFDRGLNQRLFGVTSSLIGRLTGRPATDEITRIRTIAIDGQGAAFPTKKRNVLRLMGWDAIGADEAARIQSVILEQTRMLLRAFVQARDAGK